MLKEGIMLGGRYEIISRIGSGGMADVYKARDHKLNRLVAVKVMKAEFREDTSFVAKFQKEAQAAARLSHPNVVNVFDVGEDRGLYYIVMELIEGITLKNYIQKKGKLSVKEATSIAIQVSLGLQAAHNQGIIHRDVKPQNVIISTDGKVKLSDFGIAKATNSNTITANVMGSVHYSSPEQVRGGVSDARSDIYSLGITMYEMVTGRVPFDGDSTVSIAIKHLQEEIVPPSRYTPNLPYSLEQIILKATQKNPNRRYQSVDELIEDLKHSLLDPQGDFVKIVPLNDHSSTVKMTDNEMEQIRSNLDRDKKDKKKNKAVKKYNDEDYDDEKSSKLEKGLTIGGFIIGAIIIAVLVFVIGSMAGLFNFGGFGSGGNTSSSSATVAEKDDDGQVTVPSFLGKTLDEAVETANDLGIGIRQTSTKSSDKYAEGQIMEQSVEAGEKVDKNTTIEVVVSSGTAEVTIPTGLVGASQSDAEKALTDAGLVPKAEQQSSEDVAVGNVISVDPKEGTTVEEGSSVTLYISTGSEEDEQVTVPSLAGYSESDAKAALDDLGLNYRTTTGHSDRYGDGEVIATDPASGTKVDPGSTVTLTINSEDNSSNNDNGNNNNSGSGSYTATYSLNQPARYQGGTVRLEFVQDGKSTDLYEGDNPWSSGSYSVTINSDSGDTGVINVYEDGTLIAKYDNVALQQSN